MCSTIIIINIDGYLCHMHKLSANINILRGEGDFNSRARASPGYLVL